MKKIGFAGRLTFEDAFKASRLLFPRKTWSKFGLPVVVIAGFAGLKTVALQSSWLFTILSFAGTITFFAGFVWGLDKLTLASLRKRYRLLEIEQHGIISVEYIELVANSSRTEFNWSFFTKIIQSDDLLILAKERTYVGFAPYMFQSQQDWEQAKELARQHIPQS
jgi:hypothetical protein